MVSNTAARNSRSAPNNLVMLMLARVGMTPTAVLIIALSAMCARRKLDG